MQSLSFGIFCQLVIRVFFLYSIWCGSVVVGGGIVFNLVFFCVEFDDFFVWYVFVDCVFVLLRYGYFNIGKCQSNVWVEFWFFSVSVIIGVIGLNLIKFDVRYNYIVLFVFI